jgi:hypothetical protein
VGSHSFVQYINHMINKNPPSGLSIYPRPQHCLI